MKNVVVVRDPYLYDRTIPAITWVSILLMASLVVNVLLSCWLQDAKQEMSEVCNGTRSVECGGLYAH